jgi:hypothetical protein
MLLCSGEHAAACRCQRSCAGDQPACGAEHHHVAGSELKAGHCAFPAGASLPYSRLASSVPRRTCSPAASPVCREGLSRGSRRPWMGCAPRGQHTFLAPLTLLPARLSRMQSSASVLKTVPKYVCAIWVKDWVAAALPPPSAPEGTAQHRSQMLTRSAAKSVCAGVAGAALTNPLDVIRNEMFKFEESFGQTVRRLMGSEGYAHRRVPSTSAGSRHVHHYDGTAPDPEPLPLSTCAGGPSARGGCSATWSLWRCRLG